MIFDEVFLQSQNDDCLGQVLSFLTCQDLANVGRTCKALQHTIFEAEESNLNLIWQGAEEGLTNPSDLQRNLTNRIRRARVGSNAREHCHLFAVASKAAKACELLDGIEENRIKVDGVLADLMNVRGYDPESVAEKKAIGANEMKTMEEASGDIKIASHVAEASSESAEEIEEANQRARELRLDHREKWEKLATLKAPTKTLHHGVFVRITSTATGEMISEGLCGWFQKLPWYTGLELSRECPRLLQGLQIVLDFESLSQSEEMENFIGALSGPRSVFDVIREQGGLGINMTAVVIDKRNLDIRCLFQHDLTEEIDLRMIGPGSGVVRNLTIYDFDANPRWGSDSIQLGPSIYEDLYYLRFSISLGVAKDKRNGGPIVVPLLEVNVEEDHSALHLALTRHLETHFGG